MAAGRSSFTKRQKEQNRAQKRAEKMEKKSQRAAEGKSGIGAHDDFEITEDGQINFTTEPPAEDNDANQGQS